MWSLPAPPGFQGLHPHKPVTVYQRHLPHWRQEGATYFVTYRLGDSLPQSKLDELKALKLEWETRIAQAETAQESRPTPLPSRTALLSRLSQEFAREVHTRVERWLDQGMGSCVLKHAHLAELVTAPMRHFDGVRYELGCSVVMPNHVHAVVRPLQPEAQALEDIVGSWKKHGSRRINGMLRQSGELWQEETYDRIIRDEEHLWRTI